MPFRYSPDIRRALCERMLAGERVESLAEETGVTAVTLYRWKKQALVDAGLAAGIDGLVEFMEIVIAQDADVAERAQQGIGSHAFVQGVYPEKDDPLHQFNERYRTLVAESE